MQQSVTSSVNTKNCFSIIFDYIVKSRMVSLSFKSEKIVGHLSIVNTSNISSNISISDIFPTDISAHGNND